MDAHEFRRDFLEEVKATAVADGSGSSAAFVSIFTDYLINSDMISDFTHSFYTGTGKNNRKIRVDGYVIDEFDYTFNLVIADYTGNEDRGVLTKTETMQLCDKVIYFIEEAKGAKLLRDIEPSTPAADLVDMLRFYNNKVRKYRIFLLTDGFMSERINVIEAKDINEVPVECQIWGIEKLFSVCCSEIGRQNIEIDFKAYSDLGIPCLEASDIFNDDYRSLLCIMPGKALADIYDYYGSQLLEGNVRSFLSTKVAVNKKIRETILKIPEKFFAYNNGVSATAMDLKIETTSKGKYITYAKDFQIINGGQTTASLSNARHKDKADLSKIFVQMKLTEIDSNSDKTSELIRNISRSSNSQNKVSDADFFSTHPFHIRMEQISRRLLAPTIGGVQYGTRWFYERARGQYLQAQMRMSKSAKAKFVIQHPKKQLITKTDLAKVRNTWSGLPHVVSKGAQTNFLRFADIIDEAWSQGDGKFNELYYKESIALMILFKHTEYVVSHQSWFEQGYRANIVTYSLAFLHRTIRNQYPGYDLDLQLIWNRQEVPDILTNELVRITKLIFDIITDPKRETINVTQWCKRDNCWKRVHDSVFLLNNNFKKILIDKNEEKIAERDAKKDQRIISDVEYQKKVLEYGSEFWRRVNEFALLKKLISPESEIALKYAMQIPEKMPNAYQSIKLLELLDRSESEGFKIDERN